MKNGKPFTHSNGSAYLSIKDAAVHLGVGVQFIYKILKTKNGPPHVRLKTGTGTHPIIRIPKKEFLDWVTANEA